MDERQPLLAQADINAVSTDDTKHAILVEYNPVGDAENPIEWSPTYKTCVVSLLALMAFNVTLTCIGVVPVANRIVRDLDGTPTANQKSSVLMVTIWELGEAAGPLLVGPLSELFGRKVVLNTANSFFIAATVFAACSQSTHALIAARFLTGAAVSTNVLNPAIIGDIYLAEQRGSGLSLLFLAPMIGGAIGPAISGAIAETLGWRSVLWLAAALALSTQIFLLCCFTETYTPVILRRRAAKLRSETGDSAYTTVFDVEEDKGKNSDKGLLGSITRPFRVLFGSGVLLAISLYGGVSFTFFYIIATTLPTILDTKYGLPPSLTGLSFITFSIGSILSTVVCNLTLDRIYSKLKEANGGKGQPEHRLPLVLLGALTMPLAISAFGWAAQLHLQLWILLLSVGVLGFFMLLGYLPVMAYLVDALGMYSASGMTATIITRCLAGTFFPLSAPALVEKLGYGWGFTVLGGISLALAPIPISLFRYGFTWRQRSKYTR